MAKPRKRSRKAGLKPRLPRPQKGRVLYQIQTCRFPNAAAALAALIAAYRRKQNETGGAPPIVGVAPPKRRRRGG